MKLVIEAQIEPPDTPNDTVIQKWIVDDRISGEVEWTPILPGKHGDWKQHNIRTARSLQSKQVSMQCPTVQCSIMPRTDLRHKI